MGRPPIKADLKMEKQTVWLDPPLVARIQAMVGKRGMSEFVREAAERELTRRERAAARKPDPDA